MDILKIIAALGGVGGFIGIFINMANIKKANNDKTLDRLKQISSEVKLSDPDKWWVTQAFESVFGMNLSFDMIKMLIESNVRSNSLFIISKL